MIREAERKQKKEQEALQRAKEKEVADAQKLVTSRCNKVLGKTAGIISRMEKALEDEFINDVPKNIQSVVKANLNALQKLRNVSEDHLSGSAFSEKEESQIGSVEDECRQSESNLKALNEFLYTCAKHNKPKR